MIFMKSLRRFCGRKAVAYWLWTWTTRWGQVWIASMKAVGIEPFVFSKT